MNTYSNSIAGITDYLKDRVEQALNNDAVQFIRTLDPTVITNKDMVVIFVPTSSNELIKGNMTHAEYIDLLFTATAFSELDQLECLDALKGAVNDVISSLHYTEISPNSAVIIDAEQGAVELGTDEHAWQIKIPLTLYCQY